MLAPRPARGSAPEPVGSPGPAPRYAWLAVLPAARRGPARLPDAHAAPAPRCPACGTRLRARRRPRALAVPDRPPRSRPGHRAGRAARLHAPHPVRRLRALPRAAGRPRQRASSMRTSAASGRACAAIVAPSEDLAREIRARLPARHADRVHVIPTGVDVAGIRALAPIDPRAEPGWPHDALVVGLARTPGAGEEPGRAPRRGRGRGRAPAGVAADRHRRRPVRGAPSRAGRALRPRRPRPHDRQPCRGSRPSRAWPAPTCSCSRRAPRPRASSWRRRSPRGCRRWRSMGPASPSRSATGSTGSSSPTSRRSSLPGRLADAIVAMADPSRRAAMAERARADADRFAVERRVAEAEELYERLRRS